MFNLIAAIVLGISVNAFFLKLLVDTYREKIPE